jgi:hypothetical protein
MKENNISHASTLITQGFPINNKCATKGYNSLVRPIHTRLKLDMTRQDVCYLISSFLPCEISSSLILAIKSHWTKNSSIPSLENIFQHSMTESGIKMSMKSIWKITLEQQTNASQLQAWLHL